MTKRMAEVKDRGLPLMNLNEVAVCAFGKSVRAFNLRIRYSDKFMREVPNVSLTSRPEYKRSDVERFFKLSKWKD